MNIEEIQNTEPANSTELNKLVAAHQDWIQKLNDREMLDYCSGINDGAYMTLRWLVSIGVEIPDDLLR